MQDLEILKILVPLTDSPNAPDNRGFTPISVAHTEKIRRILKKECKNAAKDLGHKFFVSGLPKNGQILFPPACSILTDKREVYYNKNLKDLTQKFNKVPSDSFVERLDKFNAGHNNGYFKSVCKKDEIGIQ